MTEKTVAKKAPKIVHKSKPKPLPVVTDESPTEEGGAKKGPWTTKTLAEQGAVLPIGVLDPVTGNFNKSFSIRPFKTKDEKTLAKLKKPHMTMAQYVSMVVATMTDDIGGVSMSEDIKIEERVAHLSRMYMGDVFYVYTWLRHQTMGAKLSLRFDCPTCRKKLPFDGDVGSVEVRSVKSLKDLRWEYELLDTFEARGKKITTLQMSSPTWAAAMVAGGIGEGGAKAVMVKHSVVGVNGESDPIVLSDAEIDELSKLDLETLIADLDNKSVGPNMAIEGACAPVDCPMGGGREFRFPIDWSYDSFFGASSR